MSFKGPKAPPPPPPPSDTNDGKAAAERAAEELRMRLQRGRASTILTGGDGVTENAPTAVKTLLGS